MTTITDRPQMTDVADDDVVLIRDVSDTTDGPAGTDKQAAFGILMRDPVRRAVEAASGGRQTVRYTAKGQPSYLTILTPYDLADIDPGFASGLHPAFTVGGVAKSEIFIGTYAGIVQNGELLSLPGVDPTVSQNFDWFVSQARACGAGWHLITNAEWAAIALWSAKNGTQPDGNDSYGRSYNHTWETGARVDGGLPGNTSGSRPATLTGSGPASWRHDGTMAGISDLRGNVWEYCGGLRLQDGEIHVIQNNDAALSATDMGSGSVAWRAIRASDGALVAPGTSGTLKYDAAGANGTGNTILSTTISSRSGTVGQNDNINGTSGPFSSMALQSGLTVPDIARALELAPVSALAPQGYMYMRNHGERLPIRGGAWNNASNAGVATLGLNNPRAYAGTNFGGRVAFVA